MDISPITWLHYIPCHILSAPDGGHALTVIRYSLPMDSVCAGIPLHDGCRHGTACLPAPCCLSGEVLENLNSLLMFILELMISTSTCIPKVSGLKHILARVSETQAWSHVSKLSI